jgi:hypothetical protein
MVKIQTIIIWAVFIISHIEAGTEAEEDLTAYEKRGNRGVEKTT